jgi:SAM-dependent methyltransferase
MQDEYNDEFYDRHVQESPICVIMLAPVFMQPWPHKSVVDIGCSIGHWLRACKQLGAERVLGYDGPWVPKDKLAIQPREFIATDLSRPNCEAYGEYKESSRFDIAICVEVAEHLPAEIGPTLIRGLCRRAPVVIFGAAIPGQGGVNHINERPREYWKELFNEQGYNLQDLIHPKIAERQDIPFWYRDNTVVFVDRETNKSPQPPKA